MSKMQDLEIEARAANPLLEAAYGLADQLCEGGDIRTADRLRDVLDGITFTAVEELLAARDANTLSDEADESTIRRGGTKNSYFSRLLNPGMEPPVLPSAPEHHYWYEIDDQPVEGEYGYKSPFTHVITGSNPAPWMPGFVGPVPVAGQP